MSRRNPADRLDAFSEKTDLEQVADAIYGASAEPELNTGRVVARPLPITDLWADVRQPRRAIPASIRLHWTGDPASVPDMLDTWASIAANAAGRSISIEKIVAGQGDGFETDGTPPIYESFISLCRLAASIRADGLINPITFIEQHSRRLIESGERRWLAYWLLRLYSDNPAAYARIPAVVSASADYVWRQAAENTARRQLNAVSMARQLALLIMAARQDQYAEYEDIVSTGGCDRVYYAQVADGQTHRVPKGSGERIQAAMGLSLEQLSQYRRLLRLTDDDEINDLLWMQGDAEDWPELAFRQVATLTTVKVREIVARSSWSLADLRDALPRPATTPVAPPPPPRFSGAPGISSSLPPVAPPPSRAGAPPAPPPPPAAPPSSPHPPAIADADLGPEWYDGLPCLTTKSAFTWGLSGLGLERTGEFIPQAESVIYHAAISFAGRIYVSVSRPAHGPRKVFITADAITPARMQGRDQQVEWQDGAPVSDQQFEAAKAHRPAPPASDKPSSPPPAAPPAPPEIPLIQYDHSAFFILASIKGAAERRSDSGTLAAAAELLSLTNTRLLELYAAGTLHQALEAIYSRLNTALAGWSEELAALLNDLEEHAAGQQQ